MDSDEEFFDINDNNVNEEENNFNDEENNVDEENNIDE
jgi:hypothetical protein